MRYNRSCTRWGKSERLLALQKSILAVVALAIAAGIWLPSVHLLFKPNLGRYVSGEGIPPKARALAARHLALWSDPESRADEIEKMRRSNAEWDFMARTFFVLALGNMALREPEARGEYLEIMDVIIDETVRLERENGDDYFLMAYAQHGRFRSRDGRSLFVWERAIQTRRGCFATRRRWPRS